MSGTDNSEVSAIQRRDNADAKSFGEGHHGRVDGPQRQVAILGYELCDPHPIAMENWLDKEATGREISKESHLRFPPQARLEEIDDFRDDELRNEEWTGVRFEKPQTRLVVVVILVDICVQRSGIDDQGYRRAS